MFGIADVYTVFFIVLGILIAFPGMIALIVFSMPKLAERSRQRVEQTPIRCFLLGLPIVGIGGLMAAGLMGSGGPLAAAGGMRLLLRLLCRALAKALVSSPPSGSSRPGGRSVSGS